MRLLHSLLDSGSTKIMINNRALPKGTYPKLLESTVTSHTLVRSFDSKPQVNLDSMILSEFDKSKILSRQNVLVFMQSSCKHDLIMGNNLLHWTQMMIERSEVYPMVQQRSPNRKKIYKFTLTQCDNCY